MVKSIKITHVLKKKNKILYGETPKFEPRKKSNIYGEIPNFEPRQKININGEIPNFEPRQKININGEIPNFEPRQKINPNEPQTYSLKGKPYIYYKENGDPFYRREVISARKEPSTLKPVVPVAAVSSNAEYFASTIKSIQAPQLHNLDVAPIVPKLGESGKNTKRQYMTADAASERSKQGEYITVDEVARGKSISPNYMTIESMKKPKDAGYMTTDGIASKKANQGEYMNTDEVTRGKPVDAEYITADAASGKARKKNEPPEYATAKNTIKPEVYAEPPKPPKQNVPIPKEADLIKLFLSKGRTGTGTVYRIDRLKNSTSYSPDQLNKNFGKFKIGNQTYKFSEIPQKYIEQVAEKARKIRDGHLQDYGLTLEGISKLKRKKYLKTEANHDAMKKNNKNNDVLKKIISFNESMDRLYGDSKIAKGQTVFNTQKKNGNGKTEINRVEEYKKSSEFQKRQTPKKAFGFENLIKEKKRTLPNNNSLKQRVQKNLFSINSNKYKSNPELLEKHTQYAMRQYKNSHRISEEKQQDLKTSAEKPVEKKSFMSQLFGKKKITKKEIGAPITSTLVKTQTNEVKEQVLISKKTGVEMATLEPPKSVTATANAPKQKISVPEPVAPAPVSVPVSAPAPVSVPVSAPAPKTNTPVEPKKYPIPENDLQRTYYNSHKEHANQEKDFEIKKTSLISDIEKLNQDLSNIKKSQNFNNNNLLNPTKGKTQEVLAKETEIKEKQLEIEKLKKNLDTSANSLRNKYKSVQIEKESRMIESLKTLLNQTNPKKGNSNNVKNKMRENRANKFKDLIKLNPELGNIYINLEKGLSGYDLINLIKNKEKTVERLSSQINPQITK